MEKKIVTLRRLQLGSGRPKIAVPLTGATDDDLLDQAQAALEQQPDILEWRLDFYSALQKAEQLAANGHKLRQLLGDIPLIVTLRSGPEGGKVELGDLSYQNIYHDLLKNDFADAIDLELFRSPTIIQELIQRAHQHDLIVILSSHDFQGTPDQQQLEQRMQTMAQMQADIVKIAVTPHNSTEVLTLLNATNNMHQILKLPLITMAMGDLGKVSRISGEVFGSCLTFAAVQTVSAPGQMSLSRLKNDLADLALTS
ncbi:type I 3-dehydroquinate dehydratase [Lactobacillus sp. DCY120]|uniref:3-dehydroquinate dehydratase n=1 Tax=Bombilactobacillus apium TaxID=2675299 RepID=A0A850R333_9LACO|nr:type I 3-dehydroquinate dehydratase [Bombilactobacillus apium]NVY96401.1 type I 3-dehydroquinate dehydratase [Bombilactobacillus apium]